MARRSITVSEIFGPTIQGEGPLAGMPSLFVRTGGCDLRCNWCDSMFAVDPANKEDWVEQSADDILDTMLGLSRGFPLLVTLTGGNPAVQPLAPLIRLGRANNFTFALETQGTVAQDWFGELDHLVLSPKGPSSGMPFREQRLADCIRAARSGAARPAVAFKFVVFDETDYAFARHVAASFPEVPVFLQTGTPLVEGEGEGEAAEASRIATLRDEVLEGAAWLAARTLGDRWFGARVGFQQHVALWGDRRGV
ncbi:MAG TPA: 7-carboxy-7-deazaguanine synthase QueE [Pyrinomonadaceae bacterium]